MLNSKGQGISIALALLSFLVVLCCVVFWKDIAAQYHLSLLRQDPGYLKRIIEFQDETPEGKAVREYLRGEEGQRAVLRLFLEAGLLQLDRLKETLPRILQGLVALPDDEEWDVWLRVDVAAGSGLTGFYNLDPPGDRESNRALLVASYELLALLQGESITLSDYPSLRFTILRREAAYERLPPGKSRMPDLGAREHVCLIERQPRIAVPVLVEMLQSRDEPTRQHAALDLFAVPGEAVDFLDTLIHGIEDRSEVVHNVIGRLLARIGEPAVPYLIPRLNHEETWIRQLAASTLGRIGPAAKGAADDLAALLADEDVAGSAGEALVAIGRLAVPDLIEVLRSRDSSPRLRAVHALSRIGPDARIAAVELKETLVDPAPAIRLAAARALVALGNGGDYLIPIAIDLVKRKEFRSRGAVAAAEYGQLDLQMFEPGALLLELGTGVVTPSTRLVADSDPFVRTIAAWLLGRLGTASRPAIAALSARLTDLSEAWYVRAYVANALGKIGPTEEGIHALRNAAEDPHVVVRRESIRALGRFGPAAQSTIEVLKRAQRTDGARRNREIATEALRQIGAGSAPR